MMETAISACEQMEAMGYNESHRHLSIETSQGPVTVFDLMVSSFTYPESIRYQIIRERHDAGADQPYVHEFSRLLVAMAQASTELVGGKDAALRSAISCRRHLGKADIQRFIQAAPKASA
ncbi:hypothetical protein KW830_02235 [Comamonas sp. CMM03]|nr:hypothetical protein [Comamonas sp. CMM03]